MSLSLFFFESLRESFLYFNFIVNLLNILVKRVFNFLILFIVLTWKIVRASKITVLYIYIDDRLTTLFFLQRYKALT